MEPLNPATTSPAPQGQPDPAAVEAFSGRMLDALNHSALVLMTSIGHRTGLFDVLATLPPSSAEAIAQAAGLQERYVREWLGAMVTAGVVQYDPAARHFALPPEHAAVLTRAATPGNLAVFAQYIPLLGSIEEPLLECFRKGGGVPYAAYPRFHDVMAEDSGQTVLPVLRDQILPLAPELVQRLEQGIEVLDVGCGVGRALNLMAEAFPNSRFRGYDLSGEAVARAQRQAADRGLRNVDFWQADLTGWQEHEAYDLVTAFDAIHDQKDPQAVLNGIARALRPDGVFLMQDIAGSSHLEENLAHPLGTLLYTISTMHCMTVSLAQGGAGLGTLWGRELARTMLREAGFASVEIHQLPHDPQNDYYVVRHQAGQTAS